MYVDADSPPSLELVWREYRQKSQFSEFLRNPTAAALAEDIFAEVASFLFDLEDIDTDRPALAFGFDDDGRLTARLVGNVQCNNILTFDLKTGRFGDSPDEVEEAAQVLEALARTLRERSTFKIGAPE